MATNTRNARRRRILQGSQDRLNLITGRVINIPSTGSLSIVPDLSIDSDEETNKTPAQSPPFISRDLDSKPHLFDHPPDKPTDYMVSRHHQAAEYNQNDGFVGRSREDPNLHRRGTSSDPPRASASEVKVTPEPSSAARSTPLSATSPEQRLATLVNLFGSVTSQQLSSAISSTKQTSRTFSITMSLLVLLSYFAFPIVGNKFIRTIILFRPLYLVMFINISLVILKLLAEFEGNRDAHKVSSSDGYGWAQEAGRALEVGLMLQNVLGSLFMDFSVYALIIICGFCLAG